MNITPTDLICTSTEELQTLRADIDKVLAARAAESDTPLSRAEAVATGAREPSEEAIEITGAKNDYNSKGKGSTVARRVRRGLAWEWVSAPASRGRFTDGDRTDTQFGEVYEGEIVAEYTLGSSRATPDCFWLVMVMDNGSKKCLKRIEHKKIKAGYRLTLPSGAKLDVTDPSWK